MTIFEFLLVSTVGYIIVMSILSRICLCIERCAASKYLNERESFESVMKKIIAITDKNPNKEVIKR